MKKTMMIFLACLLAVSLCACGGDENKETVPSTQPSQSESQSSTPADLKALAESCIDKPVEELYKLVGKPKKANYADSCLKPGVGEDGILEYDGFMVYTYREGDEEVVSYVE